MKADSGSGAWVFLVSACLAAGAIHAQEAPRFITGTRVYVSPDTPPLQNAWVLMQDGAIRAVGASNAAPPQGAQNDAACSGGVIVAGFQNSHVHFAHESFVKAASKPAAELEKALYQMLVKYGFATVVDTGSERQNTVTLRERISSGEIKGPAIFTAGIPLYPENGIPFYLRDMPKELLSILPQPATTQEAVAIVADNLTHGANGTKLFVATPQGGGKIKRMSADIAKAAADETHKRGALVMAHPTDPDGAQFAVHAGVDILVHTTIDPPKSAWSKALIDSMIAHHVSVIPTLKLWGFELDKGKAPAAAREGAINDAGAQLKAFADAGGQVLFGTDVGYMTDFDPTDEYVYMARAGLTPMQILTSLTTAPAARWKQSEQRGRVQQGHAADLVVLNSDPASDVRNFSDVKCTIRQGREISGPSPR